MSVQRMAFGGIFINYQRCRKKSSEGSRKHYITEKVLLSGCRLARNVAVRNINTDQKCLFKTSTQSTCTTGSLVGEAMF